MKKKYLLIYFLIISSLSFSQNIIGKWDFKSILHESTKNGQNLKRISEGDAIEITENGDFHYEIREENLIAHGTWTLRGNYLSLNYNLPKDTIRNYKITIDKTSLILNENGINFSFEKAALKSITPTSGISLTSIFRGILGIISLLAVAFLFSKNRQNINWKLVIKGLAIQMLFAILILKVPFISTGFEFVGKIFAKTISFTQDGTMFLFRSFETGVIESPLANFAIMILPTVIFFSALTSLFYYWGVLPKIVYGFAWAMKRTMKISGPESVAAAGNIFLGQTEAPLLVKPYLNKMTMSEMLCLMTGGMATIAGGVLAAYIGFLGGTDPIQQIIFAKHLLAASVMSAPAAIVAVKILLPEKEAYEEKLEITKTDIGSNALEAISQGTTDGLKLAVNVGAMLLVFIALISMANYILLKIGDWTTLNNWITENTRYTELSFNMILGYVGAPIAWLIGICKEDMFLVGQLLGEKTVLNEFVAYVSLGEMKAAGEFFEEKSIIMATYILCGFANLASIGIQIGGIGALAPKRRSDLSQLGILALIGGTLASLFTAVIVGVLI
ncbi:MAG: nucleoside transporter C-terminal domain-containing protein [Bacteroidota bacterium]|nr:nucleoside transporter C-terminal domain-containing protein [Bacteroidota bacterium]